MLIINLSYLPFKFSGMRNEKIFTALIRKTDYFSSGIFIEPVRLFNIKKPFMALAYFPGKFENIESNIYLGKFHLISPFSNKYDFILRRQVEAFSKRIRSMLSNDQKVCLWINNYSKFSYLLAKSLFEYSGKIVFDMADDYLSFEGNTERDRDRLFYLLEKSDVMLAVNQKVAEKYRHNNKIVFTNCTGLVDEDYFDNKILNIDEGKNNTDKKCVGFVGGLNRGRVDINLLIKLFMELPDIQFLFVGYTNDKEINNIIAQYDNAKFVEFVEYKNLKHVIKSFDVAIIPHLVNEHTEGNDLLKVIDYMACNVPVVSTPCSGVQKYSRAVHIADTDNEFIETIKNILLGKIVTDLEAGYAYAEENSWDKKIPELCNKLKESFS